MTIHARTVNHAMTVGFKNSYWTCRINLNLANWTEYWWSCLIRMAQAKSKLRTQSFLDILSVL